MALSYIWRLTNAGCIAELPSGGVGPVFSKRVRAYLVVLCLLQGLWFPQPAQATAGLYTLPFFDPTNYMSQGCHQGCAVDYSLNFEWVAAARAGIVEEVVSGFGTGACNPSYGPLANYVILKHLPDNQRTIYWHLSTIIVSEGYSVSAGEQIATSGNSGYSCGNHLHYGLYQCCSTVQANSLNPAGDWTTPDPGRVPWRADYYSENNPAGYSSVVGVTKTHQVTFKNIGGRPWNVNNDANGKSRIYLAAIYPPAVGALTPTSARNSNFYTAGDWEAQWRPGAADQSLVYPDNGTGAPEIATFTFKLYASTPGTYKERFTLRANSLFWFYYWEAAGINGFYVPYTVLCC